MSLLPHHIMSFPENPTLHNIRSYYTSQCVYCGLFNFHFLHLTLSPLHPLHPFSLSLSLSLLLLNSVHTEAIDTHS